ncbi:MAG: hypothetical protein O3B87_04710 [bacterium]|nr:hypothetical protein [bacterium]
MFYIRQLFKLLLIMALFCSIVSPSFAANNKYGIHVAQPSDEDIDRAADLVNSTGGDWGYITLVIHDDDKKVDKWQPIFDKLRERSLIPIIRLATHAEGEYWAEAHSESVGEWVSFLNDLNWVVKDRYILLFNEPNHASEWGGSVDPKSFAKVNETYARALKEANSDFFIMMGGVDLSAPQNPPLYMDAEIFLKQVISEIGVDDYNELFDGWSSHSYPNPGFRGSPYSSGRTSIRGYEWELSLLSSMGVKDLPVFITETGWNGDVLSREQIAEYYTYAYEQVWGPDNRVVAVTPFILNYQGEPFLKFSWIPKGNVGVYPEYVRVQELEKQAGTPDIIQKGNMVIDLPTQLVEQSTYHFRVSIENNGQAIWSKDRGYDFFLDGVDPDSYRIAFTQIRPGDNGIINVYLSTPEELGTHQAQLILYQNETPIIKSELWNYEIFTLPSLMFNVSLFPKFNSQGDDFELQIFNKHDDLVFRKGGISVYDGQGSLEKIDNIALGEEYRIVLIKEYYLPRQTHARFNEEQNNVLFEPLLPFDFDGNGSFEWKDTRIFFGSLDHIQRLLP